MCANVGPHEKTSVCLRFSFRNTTLGHLQSSECSMTSKVLHALNARDGVKYMHHGEEAALEMIKMDILCRAEMCPLCLNTVEKQWRLAQRKL